jgi:hypothetical protein
MSFQQKPAPSRLAIMQPTPALASLLVILTAARGPAHPIHDEAEDIQAPAFFRIALNTAANRVSITERDGQRIVESNGLPNHETGPFPNRGNPNAIQEQTHRFTLPLAPRAAETTTSAARMFFGVAVNGVPYEPGTAEFWRGERGSMWCYEAIQPGGQRTLGMDEHDAHVQPNGAYHYHALPKGLVTTVPGSMKLLGWAADGFPIYGPLAFRSAKDASSPLVALKSSYQLKTGSRPGGESAPNGNYDGTFAADYEYVAGRGDLDECNGRFGVTPEFPQGTYYYAITAQFPYLGRQFRGTPDPSFMHRGGPPGGRGGPPGGRRPPRL